MKPLPRLDDEPARLAEVRRYAALDIFPDRALDDLTALTSTICGTPISLISLVDETRQWPKSRIGWTVANTPRDISFCAHAILQHGLFVVPDATLDPRFAGNPLVTGEPGIRFYAGAPLLTSAGQALGTLCVMDRVPRELGRPQLEALRVLSQQVMAQLELRRQASELAESEGRLRAIIENEPECVKVVSREGKLLEMNPAGLVMLQARSLAEAQRKALAEFILPEHRAAFFDLHQRVMAGQSGTLEFEVIGLQGGRRWLETHATPLRDRAGQIQSLLGITRDVTERRRAEETLRASEARYRTLFEHAPDGITVSDPDGRCLDANASACRMLGYLRSELIGLRGVDVVQPSETQEVEPVLRGLRAIGHNRREWQMRRKDGSVFSAEVTGTVMADGNLLAMIRDTTERKRLERQFLGAQRMEGIGTLAGGIAHDLNNVLTPILMSADLLGELARDDGHRAIVATLQANARRGADLVKQVLSFARGVEGERATVNTRLVLRDLLKLMRETLPKSIDVTSAPAPNLWTITGDRTQIHQVLLNLCVNAMDAMPAGGRLTVSMENVVLDPAEAALHADSHPGPYVMIAVADTGPGIPAGIRDRIFEPFFTTKELGKGTGLGLSTTLAIVKSHGGFIDLHCEAGHGTTFKVYLPANTSDIPLDEAVAEPLGRPRGHGELVLVVDDEEGIRSILRRTLERYGYRVLLAAHGAEALELYRQHQSDVAVVITDMSMPTMDGPTTIAALRALDPSIRIIASSGLVSNRDVTEAVGPGVRHFVAKPYTAETILTTLQQALREGGN